MTNKYNKYEEMAKIGKSVNNMLKCEGVGLFEVVGYLESIKTGLIQEAIEETMKNNE